MEPKGENTLAVVLAAGAGSRFVGKVHKLRQPFKGQPIVRYAIDAMINSRVGHCVVVTGAVDLSDLLPDVTQIHNPAWATGQRSSVQLALDYARNLKMDSIVFALGDQPFITADSWGLVGSSTSPIAVGTYEGLKGHPVRLHNSLWDLFASLDNHPDAGVRTLMRLHPELVEEVACKGSSADIDTLEDLSQWT